MTAWKPFWITFVASLLVTVAVLVEAIKDGPVFTRLGDWVLVLPLLGLVLTLWAWAHGVVATARRSKLWALIDGVGTVVVAGVVVGFGIGLIPVFHDPNMRARSAKAGADMRSMASAASVYKAHMGTLPGRIDLVTTTSRNALGQTAGPFLAAIPKPPTGWSEAYAYTSSADGTFTLSAAGEGTTVRVP